MVKNPPASTGDAKDAGLISGLGGSPGLGNGKPLQCSCLGNPRTRGAWRLQSMGPHNIAYSRQLLGTCCVLGAVGIRTWIEAGRYAVC